MMMNRSNL